MCDRPDALTLITGASSGIGRATALRLAKHSNARLIITGRDYERLNSVKIECLKIGANAVDAILGDFRKPDDIAELCRRSLEIGPPSTLVNCAGIGRFGPTPEFSTVSWDEVIAINLTAVFLLCRLLIPKLARDFGVATVVNVTSDADSTGFKDASAYCASKGGLLAMTRSLREEFRTFGVRICAVAPGRVDTHFNSKQPGMRPGSLSADDVAQVVEFAITCSPNIDLQEVRLDSMSRH